MIGKSHLLFSNGWKLVLAAAIWSMAGTAPAEKRIVTGETDQRTRDRSVYVRVIDDRGQTSYVPIADIHGRPTRYIPVFGKHGEAMHVSFSYGKHGERHLYRVAPDTSGNIYFAANPAGKHGEKNYVPVLKPSLPRGLTIGEPGTTKQEPYTSRPAPQTPRAHVNVVTPEDLDTHVNVVDLDTPRQHVNIVDANEITQPGEPVTERQGQMIDANGNVVGFIDRKLPPSQPGEPVAERQGQLIDANGEVVGFIDRKLPPSQPGEPVAERQGQLIDANGEVVGLIHRVQPVQEVPTKVFIDDFGTETVVEHEAGADAVPPTKVFVDDFGGDMPADARRSALADDYNPMLDPADVSVADLAQAQTFLEEGQRVQPTAPGAVGAGAGDDGGYSVPQQAIGENIVRTETRQRDTHALLPGDHSGRADASTSTGPVTSPIAELAETIQDIAATAQGVNETVDAVDDIRDRFDGDDDHHAAPPAVHTPPPMAPAAAPTAIAPAVPGHTPAPSAHDSGHSSPHHPPSPAAAHTPPPVVPPLIPAASGHTPPPVAAAGWAVYINGDFLGVGNKANFKPGREQPLQDVPTESAGYTWLCPQLTLTYMGSGGFDTPRAMFRGQEYRVRADIQSYCGGSL